MNHDYAHCLDYTPNCPKECFRAQLQRDLEERRSEFIGVPLTCSHLSGTVECKLANSHNKVWKGEWIPVTERLPEEFGEYLVTKKTIGWNCEEYNSNDIAYFDNEGFHKADKVFAWMPLPEPWKGE